MDFETLWSRYRSGTADGEEISQVEAELEKFRLLEAYIEEERPPLPPPDAQRLQEELRRARRQVRRPPRRASRSGCSPPCWRWACWRSWCSSRPSTAAR